MIRLARDETSYPFDNVDYLEGHYPSVMAIMECQLLHPYDQGRLTHNETPYPL